MGGHNKKEAKGCLRCRAGQGNRFAGEDCFPPCPHPHCDSLKVRAIMEVTKIKITEAEGLHLRTAADVTNLAGNYKSRILLCRGCRVADTCSIIQVLSLAAEEGSEIAVIAEGPDEQEAIRGISGLFTPERKKVLIVDDEPDILDLLDSTLTRHGYRTAASLDGKDALEKARTFGPDLVILDLMLPGIDGWEVCRLLRNELRDVPIIILTARCMPEDRLLGLEAGADDYVTKPCDLKDLLARVERLFEEEGRPSK